MAYHVERELLLRRRQQFAKPIDEDCLGLKDFGAIVHQTIQRLSIIGRS
jgi:hypothetical protein